MHISMCSLLLRVHILLQNERNCEPHPAQETLTKCQLASMPTGLNLSAVCRRSPIAHGGKLYCSKATSRCFDGWELALEIYKQPFFSNLGH